MSIRQKIKPEEFLLTPCNGSHLDAICALQEEAFLHLTNPDLLRRNPRETLAACLQAPHHTLGAFHEGRLVAFAMLFDGGNTAENIGKDIGMAEQDLDTVMNMKLVIVSPSFWGNGLQVRLMLALEEVAAARGKRLLCGTADPANVYSCRNFLKAGYTFHSRKQKYGGLVRDIYCKEIKKA